MNAFNMTCDAVALTLPDYLDDTLEARVRTPVQRHLGECMRCAALVRDLRNIEREAATLPDLGPRRDLWAGIARRIGTPVVALEPVATRTPVAASPGIPAREANVVPIRSRFAPAWLGAAAAALVVLTAGTTYLLTTRSARPDGVSTLATIGPVTVTPTSDDGVVHSTAPEPAGATDETPVGPSPSPRRGAVASLVRSTPAQIVYEREIEKLQAIMIWRKAELDPATAATIEKNLKIIDAAIAESKAALRKDPASSMLSDQLSHTLDKKVGLLRTAAMLPSRT